MQEASGCRLRAIKAIGLEGRNLPSRVEIALIEVIEDVPKS
jgi:hypothetical protein